MIPDTKVPYSPGWYLRTLFNQLGDTARRRRLQLLRDYRTGKAPLPQGAENARSSYEAFCRMARSNFADLISGALAERMQIDGFRSAAEDDGTGDPEIGSLWRRAGMEVTSGEVHKTMVSESEAYVIVGPVDEETDASVVTAEDPLLTIGMPDPDNPRRLIAALKIKHDPADGIDRAHLFLAGKVFAPGARAQMWVAERRSPLQMGTVSAFHDGSWSWNPQRSTEMLHERVPVVRFDNADGMGEYEQHVDLLDRINHQILLRMTVAVLGAFRQRAVRGLPTVYPKGHPKAGQEVDYSGVFVSDPAAIWQLPESAEMWESELMDLRPILEGVAADVQHLASVTRTPLHLMMPAGDNQSAEGANLQREGLTFKARNRIARTTSPWSQTVALMLMQAGQTDRKMLSKLEPIWASPELRSLNERADAASKAANDIPRRSRLQMIWGFTPTEVDRMETEWADERLLQQQMANALAAATPVGPQAAGGAVPGNRQQPGNGQQQPGNGQQQQQQQSGGRQQLPAAA